MHSTPCFYPLVSDPRTPPSRALAHLHALMVALAVILLSQALTLPPVAHRPQLAVGRQVARHPQLQLLASSASPKETITPTAGLSVGVACIGCVLFGYHLGVVNAPLDAISATLGFAGDAVRQGRVVSFGLAGAFLGSLGGASSHTMLVHKPHAVHSPHTSLTAACSTPQAGRSPTASAARAASRTRRRPVPSARPCAPARAPSLRCCLAASSAAWASAPRSAASPSSSRRWRRHHSAASSPLSTRCPACLPAHPPACPPAYVSPSASPRLCLPQLFTCGGILLSIVAGLPLARAGPAYWRKMFAVAVLPCIAQLGALLAVPESPRWLAQAGRTASNPASPTRSPTRSRTPAPGP